MSPSGTERAIKAMKVVAIAVGTVTTAVMCANLVAFSHFDGPARHNALPAHGAKVISVGHESKVTHA